MADVTDAPGTVLLVRGPSTGGIRRHVEALAARLPVRHWTPVILEVRRGPAAWWAIRRAAHGIDVIHAHGLTVGWWASAVPRRPPLVVTVHNVVLDGVAGWRAPLLRRLERWLPRRVDAVIATSPMVAARLGGAAAVVRPMGPPPTPGRARDDVRREWGVPATAPVAAAVGRLHPQKGLDTVLDAMGPLGERVPAAHVVLVGAGPLEGRLRQRIAAEGLTGRVHLVGPAVDTAGALLAADVVMVASVWESGPLVVSEAMELGRPVVATPVGFVPELIADGESGRIVASGNAGALAAAVADLLLAPQQAAALGEAGRQRVAVWLDRGAAVDAVVAVYEAVRRRP